MRLFFALMAYCSTLIFVGQAGASDEQKAKGFFKNNLAQSAENYVSARIEQSLSERFRNVEIDITNFKNNPAQSAENYVSARIEQSLSERFRNFEIDIIDLDGEDTRYSIFTVQPLYDNAEAGRATFFQGGIIATDNDDTFNLGLGQRWILNDGKVIAGLNLFYDNEWDAGHERMSVGGKLLTSVGDFRVNSYTALSDTQTVNGVEETALDGMDMELALPLPYLPNTRIHAKSFKWDGENGAADLEGDTISLRSALPLGFSLEAGSTSYDANAANDADFVSLSFNVARFHQQQYVQQPKLVSSQAFALIDITERRFEKVRRTNRIFKQVEVQQDRTVEQVEVEQGGGLTVKFR